MHLSAYTMSKRSCLLWLRLACITTVVTGLLAVMASHSRGEWVWRILFDLLKGFDSENKTVFTADNYATNAVLGGVMIGWGTMMYSLVSENYFNERVRVTFLRSLSVWFLFDCAGSMAAGLFGNIVLNLLFMLMFLPPLFAIKEWLQ